jgi:membrane protein
MGGEAKPAEANASRDASRSAWLPLRALPRICRQASSDWINDDIPRLGAAVAFYTLLSLAPVIVITVALAAVFYGQEAAEGRLAAEIRGVGGPELARTIQEIIKGGRQPRIGVSAAGAPMVVLLWVYYSAQLCFWGAEFTKVYAQTVGSQRDRSVGEG